MVPETGVEPVRNFVAADFKSATSTNSVIPAPKPMLRTLSGFSERTYEKRKPAASFSLEFWSGRRVSNSRPQPWQGCALPTELLPHSSCEGFELYTVFRDWQELSSKKAEKYHKHGIQIFIFQAFSGDSRRKSAFSSSVLRSPTQPSPVATVRSASSRLRSSMSLMRSSKVPAQRKR